MTTQSADVALVDFSVGAYRLLLAAYPPQFRREYGPHMLQVFQDCSISTYNQSGPPGMLRLWAITFLDFTRSVVEEHIQRETFMTRETLSRLIGGGFAFWWVLASTVGGAVGLAVNEGVGKAMFRALGESLGVGGAVGFAVVGASLGIAQWLVLRRQFSRSAWWVLATIAGGAVYGAVGRSVYLAVFGVVGVALGTAVGKAVGLTMSAAVFGVSSGIAQWLFLRRQVSRVGWWVLASAVGAIGGSAVGLGMGVINGFGGPVFRAVFRAVSGGPAFGTVYGAIGGAVFGAVFGAITGIALVWLLRQPAPRGREAVAV